MDLDRDRLEQSLQEWRDRLLSHPLYSRLVGEDEIHHFMTSHVFAVWDFQSLLKALQRCITCVEVPWLPSSDPESRRLINEIVLDEESDEAPGGGYLSHFELYLRGMAESGADVTIAETFLAELRSGQPLKDVLQRLTLPPGVTEFVDNTIEIATSGEAHLVAAAFTYGREDVIPGMFQRVIDQLAALSPERWGTFHYYLDRHIHTDADRHYPMTRRLVSRLCGDDPRRWEAAAEVSIKCLKARLNLWDAILTSLPSRE